MLTDGLSLQNDAGRTPVGNADTMADVAECQRAIEADSRCGGEWMFTNIGVATASLQW